MQNVTLESETDGLCGIRPLGDEWSEQGHSPSAVQSLIRIQVYKETQFIILQKKDFTLEILVDNLVRTSKVN